MEKADSIDIIVQEKPTVELDYVSLHPCMLLNKAGKKCPKTDIYSKLLKELGIRKTKERRDAIKEAFLIATNIPSVKGFYSYLGRDCSGYQDHLRESVKPKDVYDAILKLYPKLEQHICSGKRRSALQVEDSEIMIDVLETLANKGIVSLPVHDSMICREEHAAVVEQVMRDCYKRHMGFDIQVEAK